MPFLYDVERCNGDSDNSLESMVQNFSMKVKLMFVCTNIGTASQQKLTKLLTNTRPSIQKIKFD